MRTTPLRQVCYGALECLALFAFRADRRVNSTKLAPNAIHNPVVADSANVVSSFMRDGKPLI